MVSSTSGGVPTKTLSCPGGERIRTLAVRDKPQYPLHTICPVCRELPYMLLCTITFDLLQGQISAFLLQSQKLRLGVIVIHLKD